MSTLRNSVRLTGFLGSTPELKTTSNDKKFAKLSLVVPGNCLDQKPNL